MSVAVRLHERNIRVDALEPDAVHHATLDRSLALQHESELDEEPVAPARSSTTMRT